MRALVAAPLAALSFLTIMPVPGAGALPPRAFPRAVGLFPLAGAAIGVVVALVDASLRAALPPGVLAALDLGLLAALSGGLHLDGLADSADGLLGGHGRAERLAIMRQGTIGAFGAATLVVVLLADFAALSELAERGRVLVGAAAASRWAVSLALWRFPYARPSGVGRSFKDGLTGLDVALGCALALLVAVAALGAAGLALVAAGAVVALAVGRFAAARLGGLTGDVYGAICELSFASALLVALGGRG